MDVRDKLRAASQRLLQGFKDSRGTRDRRGKGTQREGFISSELAKILPESLRIWNRRSNKGHFGREAQRYRA